MNEKNTAHPQKEEREKVLKEIRQLENRKKILENKQRNEERRVRTRRLIERGAILEGIFPLAPNLSSAEVKAFLIKISSICAVNVFISPTQRIGSQAFSPSVTPAASIM